MTPKASKTVSNALCELAKRIEVFESSVRVFRAKPSALNAHRLYLAEREVSFEVSNRFFFSSRELLESNYLVRFLGLSAEATQAIENFKPSKATRSLSIEEQVDALRAYRENLCRHTEWVTVMANKDLSLEDRMRTVADILDEQARLAFANRQ